MNDTYNDNSDEGIEFDQDISAPQPQYEEKKGMADLLIKYGIVSNKTQANYILLALIGILVTIILVVSFASGSGGQPTQPTGIPEI